MEAYNVNVEDTPSDEEMDIVENGLHAYVDAHSKLTDLRLLAVFLRDKNHQVVGVLSPFCRVRRSNGRTLARR